MKLLTRLNLNKIWKKLALGAVFTVLFTMLIMNFIILRINRYNTLNEFNSDLDSMVNVAAYSLEEPLWNLNEETLTSICDSFFQKETVSQIVVKDLTLGVMYERKMEGQPHREELLITAEKDILHNNSKIGVVQLTMTKYYINQQNLRSTQIHFLEMILLVILLVIVLIIIISRITKPLSDLNSALRTFGENEEVKDITVNSNDEIGDLAGSFNDMSRNIMDARNAIHQLNEELEQKVENRTYELHIKNQELEESLEIIRETEQELLESNHSLSSTLKELREVQDLLIESGKMALLGELVAGVAHEINTPIGVSLTMSSFIEKEVGSILKKVSDNKLSKKDFTEFLERIEESSSSVVRNLLRAGELITSFKQVAVDQTSHSVRRFNFHDYVNETIMNLQSQFKNRAIDIINKCPNDLNIVSYPGAYAQVFTNLVMNSLIHAYEHEDRGEIVIEAEVIKESLKITFSDDGQGIPNESVKKVFNPFYTTKRGLGGTGLGLNITYNIAVNILKGTIVCESEINKGTAFIMTVPLHHPDINESLY